MWWLYPMAFALGFGMQWLYMPSTVSSPGHGMALIALIHAGGYLAYWWGWR